MKLIGKNEVSAKPNIFDNKVTRFLRDYLFRVEARFFRFLERLAFESV